MKENAVIRNLKIINNVQNELDNLNMIFMGIGRNDLMVLVTKQQMMLESVKIDLEEEVD